MKQLFLFLLLINHIICLGQTTAVGIGTTTPHNSAVLDIQSSSKGMLIPRMTTTQRTAIAAPATGLLVFDNTTGTFWFRNNASWTELVDTTSMVWKKNGNHAYTGVAGNIGVGTSNPAYDIHIAKPSPSLGFFDAGNNRTSGIISGSASNMYMNAYRAGLFDTNPKGHLILQNNQGLPQPLAAGNVGIGTNLPDTKLQIEDGTNISSTAGGFLQIGASTGANIAADDNQIQARNNGAASRLYMQTTGGDLQIGGTNAITINDGYQVYRNRPLSTNADLLPIAYAKMDGWNVSVLSGTGNLSLQRIEEGYYQLALLGEPNLYANRNQYSIFITANYTTAPTFANAEIKSNNFIEVKISKPDINYSNHSCNTCITASYINNAQYWKPIDITFSIIIYKM